MKQYQKLLSFWENTLVPKKKTFYKSYVILFENVQMQKLFVMGRFRDMVRVME